jgi:hypothetical protein
MRGKTGFVRWGLLIWLVAMIFFRFLGQFLLDPANPRNLALAHSLWRLGH